MNTATVTTWLLTYLAHSTILLGAAWLAARFMGDRRLALQEILLRTALVGGLLTATLQVGLGVEPIGGSLAIAELSPAEVVFPRGETDTSFIADETIFSPTAATDSPQRGIWPAALLSLWGIGSMLALSILGRSILDLRRLLKTRRFRPPGRLLDRLATAMGLRRAVRLSTTAAIAVPFATGVRKPEICCPERVGDLAFDHQKSLFAHELAHLSRRDPAWQLLYRIGEALFFLQPLNRIVRRRLEEIAEHLTDERAVACTGDRLGLARCLVVVAHWGISDAPGVPATAFAAGPRLDRRVRHLISGAVGQHRTARWTAPLLAVLVVGSVLLLPAIAPSAAHADISPTASDAVPAQSWSTSADDPEAEASAAPAPPAVPPSSEIPRPVLPVTDAIPAPDVVPLSPAKPQPVSAPAPAVEPAPATAPNSNSESPPPTPPTAPEPPPRTNGPDSEETTRSQREKASDEARNRQPEAQRELSEAERKAREQARAFAKQAREMAHETAERSRLTEAQREKLMREFREQSRLAAERLRLTEEQREEMRRRLAELHARSQELAREAAERPRLTDAERERIWDETRELRRQAEAEAREYSRLTAKRMRFTEAEREEIFRRTAELRAESWEQAREAAREAKAQARELAEQARRLAEEAEAERQREEQQRRHDRNED
jgi:beta-lactamase regulating signal transducer with metallopeptidase domain